MTRCNLSPLGWNRQPTLEIVAAVGRIACPFRLPLERYGDVRYSEPRNICSRRLSGRARIVKWSPQMATESVSSSIATRLRTRHRGQCRGARIGIRGVITSLQRGQRTVGGDPPGVAGDRSLPSRSAPSCEARARGVVVIGLWAIPASVWAAGVDSPGGSGDRVKVDYKDEWGILRDERWSPLFAVGQGCWHDQFAAPADSHPGNAESPAGDDMPE
jgi:hypothetical protein